MPEYFPAKLRIPTGKGGIAFTMDNNDKIADFEKRVLDNSGDELRSFELFSGSSEETSDKTTLGQLKQNKFKMRVNNKVYDVYPDLISLTRDPVAATKHKKEIAKIEGLNNSIPIARQIILRDFYSHLVA